MHHAAAQSGRREQLAVRYGPRAAAHARGRERKPRVSISTWGDEERNIRVGALANKFYRERLAYSSSVGVHIKAPR